MGDTVKLTADDGHSFDAYVARPAEQPKAGLVIVQEIFGVNVHIRGVADGFAADGYLAIAPALFDRVEPGIELGYDKEDVAEGRRLRSQLKWEEVLSDVSAAMGFLAGAGKVGVVGYCWGGSVAWACATRLGIPAVGYYGGRTAQLMHERPQAPAMLHFGAKDHLIPMSDVTKLRYAHQHVPMHVYDAGHGFNCDDRTGSYDRAAADLALQRTLDFLKAHLV
jgi:carboxymethylenebutenolidase